MNAVVIAGAAGFLGSHLAKALVAEGRKVIGIDNLSTGSMLPLIPILGHPLFTLLPLDVVDISLDEHWELKQAAQIYHLASPASPKYYQADPLGTIAANTSGTMKLLELARRTGAKLLYASTSEAYGDPEVHPQSEAYRGHVNTWGPRACYDESKRLGEVYCYEYHNRYGVDAAVARIFNTYSAGLRNDDGRVISNFVWQALNGTNLTVYGDGSQTRSFCYVDDTIEGLRRMMRTKEAGGEIINIGNPAEYAVLDVAKLVIRLTGTASGIVFHPLPQDDPRQRRPDIAKAKRILNWEPSVTLEEGLRLTIAEYRQSLQAPKRGLYS